MNIRNAYIDIGIDMKYLNTEGKNLFEIDNGYNESDITIYHKKTEKMENFYLFHQVQLWLETTIKKPKLNFLTLISTY